MDERDMARVVGMGRIGFGLGAIVLPSLVGTLFIDSEEAKRPATRLLGRLFGIRDVALGLSVIRALDRGEDATEQVRLGMACDLADIGVLLLGAGKLRARTVLLGVATAAAFATASGRATATVRD